MRPPQITAEMYAGIPALLEQGKTKTEIAAMYGVTLGSLVVCCSRRGISLRKGLRRALVLPLSDDVLKSLRDAARRLGKGSAEWLASELLRKIASDDLYMAVLDEEATPDKSVTPAPQSDLPSPPPSEQIDPTGFFRSPPLVNDQDSSITAGAPITTATTISAHQGKKIEEICKTLVACGLVALDDQAQALGLCRSTTWTLLRGTHKSSGLSASTVNKILSAPRLPASVRLKVLEYVAEKVTGEYGDRSHRLRAYVRRLDPRHLQAGPLEVSTTPRLERVAAT